MTEKALVVRVVPAIRGWRWMADGFMLFTSNAPVWVFLFSAYFFFSLLIGLTLPGIGSALSNLLGPFVLAGFMKACRAVEEGEPMRLQQFFAAFRQDPLQILGVGAYFLFGLATIGMVAQIAGGEALKEMVALYAKSGESLDEARVLELARELLPTLALVSLLHVPLLMGYWFAPALVIFDRAQAVEAVLLSFRACLGNMLPFLLYGILATILFFLGIMTLGFGFAIVGPVIIASIYASYRDVFRVAPEPATSA